MAQIPIATEEEDRKWTEDFRAQWAGTPYPPIFVTADTLMVQDNQILLIRRGRMPGRGRLALPGGHVNQDELIRDAAIRELVEETSPPELTRSAGIKLNERVWLRVRVNALR